MPDPIISNAIVPLSAPGCLLQVRRRSIIPGPRQSSRSSYSSSRKFRSVGKRGRCCIFRSSSEPEAPGLCWASTGPMPLARRRTDVVRPRSRRRILSSLEAVRLPLRRHGFHFFVPARLGLSSRGAVSLTPGNNSSSAAAAPLPLAPAKGLQKLQHPPELMGSLPVWRRGLPICQMTCSPLRKDGGNWRRIRSLLLQRRLTQAQGRHCFSSRTATCIWRCKLKLGKTSQARLLLMASRRSRGTNVNILRNNISAKPLSHRPAQPRTE